MAMEMILKRTSFIARVLLCGSDSQHVNASEDIGRDGVRSLAFNPY